MGCHFFFQGIFPTQGLNSSLQHCRATRESLRGEGCVQGQRGGMKMMGWGGGLPLEVGLHILREWIRRRNVVKNI